MIELDEKMLRGLQMTELDLLCELDRICRKHGISYHIIAGTMLGAVRHGGFIPWDDDADVAMLRDEYERFRTICATELDPEKYVFQDHTQTPGYRWGYGKLRRRDSLFLREHQEHMPYEQGVFIDVFPIDSVPQSRLGRTVWNVRCFLIRKALWARVGRIADRSALKRFCYRILDAIPEKKILRRYEKLIGRSRKIRSEWARILMFPTPNRQWAYRRKWYEKESEPIVFEGRTFSGVADADGYLTFKFGNYHELPPVHMRKTHPVSGFRLPKEMEIE